ncbi:hypothetical protein RhiirB3_433814 [Rhizophagus irregularis]|nr:hypothetical protein RhiirB3_433814 [Rhizophagus irregularis]
MKKCWDSNPSKRPTIYELYNSFKFRKTFKPMNKAIIEQAEERRMELINFKQLSPEFSEKYHSKAIYTSRPLSSIISKITTIDSSLMLSFNIFNVKQVYITKEFAFDINNIQRSYTQNTNSVDNISTAVPVNFSRKRNFEELKVEIQKSRKYIKNDNSDENNVEYY